MGQRVIADNWSLQAVGELLTRGLDQDDNPGIGPLTDPELPNIALPQAAIDLEALFDLLTDVLLRDQILVDDQFHDAWFGSDGPLGELAKRSIVRPHPFLEHPERLDAPRREFLRRLVINSTMAREQDSNEAAWAKSRTTPHPFTSQLVWGGAGMMARAWVYQAPYTPHPLRQRLFSRTGVVLQGPANGLSEFKHAMAQHRAVLYQSAGGGDGQFGAQVLLPALPALVIQDASSLSDIFVVASQMREQLSDVRSWLSQFQEALGAGDFKAIDTARRRLRTLSKDVERALGQKSAEGASLSIGWSWLRLNLKLDARTWVPSLDRVQTQVAALTFAPSGAKELRKLLGFFGHDRSAIGLRTMEHFSARQLRQPPKQ